MTTINRTSRASSNQLIHGLMQSTALVLSIVSFASPAQAVDDLELPTGGTVVGGSATFDYSAPGRLDVGQSSDRLVVDWNSFNIGKDATTTFIQPGSNSLAVNRVTGAGQDPTKILGTLMSNGKVMVLDRNGVIFGRTARIDVGGLVASTGSIDTAAVMSGADRLALTNMNGTGDVINEGEISVSEGGLAALVAPSVRNSGVISAKLGKVALAAGEQVTVDLYGDNLIEVALDSTASKAVIDQLGTISAEGGVVQMTARAAKDVVDSAINMDGVINASSVSEQGGRIVLGADTISFTGKASANGGAGKAGGDVRVIGSKKLTMGGQISAMGNDGTGFVDTSAPNISFAPTAAVQTSGHWLIDPTTFVLDNVIEGILESALVSGDVSLLVLGAGDSLDVQRTVDWSTDKTLTFDVNNDVSFTTVNAGINATGAGNFILKAGGNVAVQQGMGMVSNGGNITITSTRFRLDSGVVNANGGNVAINTTGGFQALANSIRTSGTGQISLTQNKDADAFLSVNSIQNAINSIQNTGTGSNTLAVGAGVWAEDVTADVANLTLAGANAGIAGAGARGAETEITPTTTGIKVAAHDVVIDGVKVSGGTQGMRLNGSDRTTLVNNIVSGSSAEGIALTAGSDQALIANNLVQNTGKSAISVFASDASRILNNVIDTVNGDGVLLSFVTNGGGQRTEIKGNSISNLTSPELAFGSGVHAFGSHHVDIGGMGPSDMNVIWNTGWDGVSFYKGSDVNIVGNDIQDVLRSGVFVDGVNGLGVSNNAIRNAQTYFGIDVVGATNSVLSTNYVQGTHLSGINVTDLLGTTIINGNWIYDAGWHGIRTIRTSDMTINYNQIGGGKGNEIIGDGIHVEEASNSEISGNQIADTLSFAFDTGSGIQVLNSSGITIGSLLNPNLIRNVEWDGVRVDTGSNISTVGNQVAGAIRTGTYYEAIDTGTIADNSYMMLGRYGVNVQRGSDLLVSGNMIDGSGFEGINVEKSGGVNRLLANLVNNTGRHGISVKETADVTIARNVVGSAVGTINGAGIYVNTPGTALIGGVFGEGNTIENVTEDGINVRAFGSGIVEIRNNDVSNAGTNGIRATDVDQLTVAENIVTGAVGSGVLVGGTHYGTAVVSDNAVSGADIGMTFQTGLIDLQGPANWLDGGSVGYRFAPLPVLGGFGDVDLAGNTIGTTLFTGQSTYYVELLNTALFAPGAPTLEDGLNATYDGFSPSSVGGILTPAQLTALENMFWHYNDDNTVGLFFLGNLDTTLLSRVFRQNIQSFVPGTGNAGFTITGLPFVPGGTTPPAPPTTPTNPADLNQLAPAAGGENQGEPTGEELASLAPAAGGSAQDTACWSDAVSLASNGQAASYNFSTDPLSALQDATNCGAQQNN